METKGFFDYTTNGRQSDWSAFEKVFAKDGEYDSEFNLPRRWNGKDFYADLHGLLERYVERIGKVHKDSPDFLSRIEDVCTGVLEAVRVYLHGYPAKAYDCIEKLMKKLKDYPLYFTIEKDNADEIIGSLYRMSTPPNNNKAGAFHVPYNLRHLIGTTRYSIAGYPCLYLADSLDLAEHEVGCFANKKEKAIAARFELVREHTAVRIRILDFGYRPQDLAASSCSNKENGKNLMLKSANSQNNEKNKKREEFERAIDKGKSDPSQNYMLWYPILASCSYVRETSEKGAGEDKGRFASEYIVPQLITQWIRSQSQWFKTHDTMIVGIRYFSCRSEEVSTSGRNYVFPTSGDPLILDEVKPYCPVLNELFLLTEPKYISEYKGLDELQNNLKAEKTARAFPLTSVHYAEKKEAVLPNGLMSIAAGLFRKCKKLETIEFPNGLVEVGSGAFGACERISELILPEGLTNIGNWAFYDCFELETLTLPKSLIGIGRGAFKGCKKLKEIVYTGTKEQWLGVEKGSEWDKKTGEYMVKCSDGNLPKAQANGEK